MFKQVDQHVAVTTKTTKVTLLCSTLTL